MTNDKDSAVLAERVERVTKWLDGGCSTWGTPMQDIREILNALRQPTQSDALLDAEGVKLYWYRQGKDDGADAECAKIVAWLRGQDGHGYDAMRAECIEAGEHLK